MINFEWIKMSYFNSSSAPSSTVAKKNGLFFPPPTQLLMLFFQIRTLQDMNHFTCHCQFYQKCVLGKPRWTELPFDEQKEEKVSKKIPFGQESVAILSNSSTAWGCVSKKGAPANLARLIFHSFCHLWTQMKIGYNNCSCLSNHY